MEWNWFVMELGVVAWNGTGGGVGNGTGLVLVTELGVVLGMELGWCL